MRHLYFIIPLFLIYTYSQAQDNLREVKYSPTNSHIVEVFNVDSNDVRQGSYAYYYKGLKMQEGTYKDGKKNGEWIYNNEGYKIIGKYTDDEKDSVWYFYNNENLQTRIDNSLSANMQYDTGYYKSGSPNTVILKNKITGITTTKTFAETGTLLYLSSSNSNNLIKDVKYFDEKGLTNHYIIKNDLIYSLVYTRSDMTDSKYRGNLKDGTGKVEIYYYDHNKEKDYLAIELNMIDGKLEGTYKEYYKSGNLNIEGKFVNNYRQGIWTNYKDKKRLKVLKIEEYSIVDSSQINNYLFNSSPFINDMYVIVEDMPSFFGKGKNGFREFIAETLVYPDKAQKMGISGIVYIQFVVNRIGEVIKAEVVRGADPMLDKEALRVVNASPIWAPGVQGSFPVSVKFVFPIKYILR